MFKSIRTSLGLSPTKRSASIMDDASSPSRTRDDSVYFSEPSIWGKLEVMGKSGKVKSGLNLLERDCTVGRSTDNDVRLCELNVSRHACRIHFLRAGKARLELLGTNHVTINGSHILPLPDSDEPVSVYLSSGDLIELSKYRFRFSYAAHDAGAASTSQLQSVYVPTSPAEKGRQSLQGLATPDGKRRKVRTSLVRAADVETPSKARETFARLDALDAAPQSQGLADSPKPRTTFVQLTPRPSLTSLSLDSGSPLRRHMLGSNDPVMLTEESLRSMEKSLGLISISQEIPGYGGEEGVQEELVVIDEDDDEDVEHQEKPEPSGAADPALSAREAPQSPDEVAAKKERRRSSFLGRAWPFSSPEGFYGAERENEAQQDQPSTPERPLREEQERADAEEEVDDSEEEQEADQSDILSPRLPRSLSSPGRLGSPSFHISSRRKVSLRTKTLLRSSAALVERMAASQSDSFLGLARSEDQGRPLSPLAVREAEEEGDYEDDEDEVDRSLSLVEEGEEDYGGSEQDEQGGEEHEPVQPIYEPVQPIYEPEPQWQSTPEDEPLASEPAAIAGVEDRSDLVSEEPEQVEEQQPGIMLPSLSRPTSRSSKRLSMPAFVGRRRSLFGLGILPRGQTSNEAEDVVGKVEEMFAKPQGSASSVDTGYEARSSGSASPDVGYQSMLTAASCENLKGPAREALRYLLSNKSKATSPAIGSDSGDASQPAASAATATSGLRSLMLGRQEPMLLQRARTSKRSSLTLAPGTPVIDGLRSMSPQAGSTPDLAFLRHVFALPKEETDTDPQLRALRYLFAEHESVLSRAEEAARESYFDGEALALLMATPAAQRTLVSAASRVARLTPTESAQQAAAAIEIPLDVSPSLLHMQNVASPSQAASLRRGNMEQSPSPLVGGEDNDAVPGDETPSYKKTRRGCRGGRRRSRNFSPSIDLGALDIETALGDVGLPHVIPEEPLSAEAEGEAEAVAEASLPEAQQSSDPIAPFAPFTPAASPSKARAVRASRQETSNKPLTAAEVLKRSGSNRARPLTAATTANTRSPARTEKAHIAANSAPGEEENSSTQAEQEATASPVKPTRARSTRRAAEVPAQPQAGDEEEAMGARPARRGARRAEPSKPAVEEVVSSPVKSVTRKTSTRTGAGRKQRAEAAEEDEVEAQRQLPASEPAMPVSTRSRRGAREAAPAPPAAAPAPTRARSTRAREAKSTTTSSTRGRGGHESDDQHDQNDNDDKEDVDANEEDDANDHEAERALRRSTRSSPVKKRAAAPREVQSSPVKPAARTTRRAAAGGAGHSKEPSIGDVEAASATITRTTRRKAAATVPEQETEHSAPVARATRSTRGAKKA